MKPNFTQNSARLGRRLSRITRGTCITLLCFFHACDITAQMALGDEPSNKRPNVLFIAVDDLNDYAVGLNSQFRAHTPHMDALAGRGTLFTNAHCAAPVCNPSRASVMTGVAPATSGVYTNQQDWRENKYLKQVTTLPQHFRDHGYTVLGGGKLYHAANLSETMLEGYLDARPWHEYFPSKHRQLPDDFVPAGNSVNSSNDFYGGRFDWDAMDIPDDEMGDGKVVTWAEKQLKKEHAKPLFLAVGIYRPHIPWYTPKSWFDMYPNQSIRLPEDPATDLSDVPETGVETTKRVWHQWLVDNDKWDDATHAYLASTSFADAMVGRLIQALDNGPMADNTVIVLWSDHGYHLGHKQHWEKRVLWEQATHVPLIVVNPKSAESRPGRCDQPVSLLDIYPTLSDMCNLNSPDHLDGFSLRPLLDDPDCETHRAVVTTYLFQNHSIRSQHHRYIRYADGSEELYDHQTDPAERNNLASTPEAQEIKHRLAVFLPKKNAPGESKRKKNNSRIAKPFFKDDFERNESQETREEIGNGWESNSEGRADGRKQVDLQGGAMHIVMHEDARHPVSVRHRLNTPNGEVRLRFQLPQGQGLLGVDLADTKDRSLLGGHIFKVFFKPDEITIQDMKRARKNRQLQERKKAGTLTEADQRDMKESVISFPATLASNQWYRARITFHDDLVRVYLNERFVGELKSHGLTHRNKEWVRLAVTRSAVVDDVQLFSSP